MANNGKRRGMNPVVAFLLGFLLALILLVGSVAGIIFFALNYKLDKIEANKTVDDDGNTKYIYINADPESGGAETVLDLVSKMVELASDTGNLTIGKLESLLPVTGSITDKLHDSLANIIDLDMDKVKSLTFSELGGYFMEAVMDIRPAALIETFGGGGLTENMFVDLILNGKEADYVEVDGEKYPVYYELLTLSDGEYLTGEGFAIPENQQQFITVKNGENRLYYFNYGNFYYITQRGEDGAYSFNDGVEYVYNYQSDDTAVLTGSYYYDAGGKVEVSPVTLGTLASGSALDVLDELLVADLMGGSDGISGKILGNITVGDLMDGNVDFEGIINELEIAEFIDVDPDNNIMVYLAYGITGVLNDVDGYKGNYTLDDGTVVTCCIQTEPSDGGKKITGAYYFGENGERVEIKGTTVNEMDERLDNLTDELALADLVIITAPDVASNNAIMIFLAYSISDLEQAEGQKYSYTAKYYSPELDTADENYLDSWQTAYVCVDESTREISDVYIVVDGVEMAVQKTAISGVSNQINRLSKTLKLKDIITIDQNSRVMVKLGDYVLDNIGNAVNDLALSDFIDATLTYTDGTLNTQTSEVILAYMTYGVTGIVENAGSVNGCEYTHTAIYHTVKDQSGNSYKYDCYLTTEDTGDKVIITGVFYFDGNGNKVEVAGTPVNGVSERIAGVTSDITIGELVSVEGNKFLSALSGSTIESLSADINNLAINELYADSIYASSSSAEGETVLRYLAVNADPVLVQDNKPNSYYIYYVKDDNGEFVLASTTGKLTEFSDGVEYYSLGERVADGETVYLIKFDSSYIYYTKDTENGKFELVNAGAENAGKVDKFEENTYYTFGSANALWKLLLYVGEGGNKTEKAYSVNNLTDMVSNVTQNTQNTTMRELHEAGIMTFNDESELDIEITGTNQTIGDLTLAELVGRFVGIFKPVSDNND